MHLLVTGREGQLVRSLMERAEAQGIGLSTIGRPDMDMADPAAAGAAIAAAIAATGATHLISAAAHTAVDQAEDEPELAFAINAAAPGAMAAAAHAAGVPIIHVSTDYVFSGDKDGIYTETDPTGPTGVYGASKLAGEEAVRQACPQHVIVRTAWVYSPFGKNFVRTMLRVAETRDSLTVVADQHGNPTSALDIADGIIAACRTIAAKGDQTPWGTYHLAGTGTTHWAGFADEIFAQSRALGGPSATVTPIPTSAYPTKARRPANSRLDTSAFHASFGYVAPAWQTSLGQTLQRLLAAA